MNINQTKRTFSKDELEAACKNSHNFTDLQRNLGYKSKEGSNNVNKRLRKLLIVYEIDFSHFDRYYKSKLRRIHPLIDKECPICNRMFKESSGRTKEKVYCSYKCSNKLRLGKRHSLEVKQKISLALRGRPSPHRNKSFKKLQQLDFLRLLFLEKHTLDENGHILYVKICEYCNQSFNTKYLKTRFCCAKCSGQYKWTQPNYRNNIISQLNQSVKNGKHKGWQSRNVLSYPEKFFKKVLELNGYRDKFTINHSVKKRDLGIDCDACYFIDFYFPEYKLDLEIDGKQHDNPERKEHDNFRDKVLIKNGYIIYRIKWKGINSAEGKAYMKGEINKLFMFIQSL